VTDLVLLLGRGLLVVLVLPGGGAGTSAGVWFCSPVSAACSGAGGRSARLVLSPTAGWWPFLAVGWLMSKALWCSPI